VLADGLGSTVGLTAGNGTVVGTYSYDAFGNAVHTGTVEIPFTFTGQLRHERSGMLLFPARAYDPQLGRFISEDPLFALNLYAYAGNNPVNLVDPTGMNIEEYAQGGDAAWRNLVYRALVRGEANGVRVVSQGRTSYNLLSQYQSVSYQLRYLGQWL
jgi:RHS repeat-associated protein